MRRHYNVILENSDITTWTQSFVLQSLTTRMVQKYRIDFQLSITLHMGEIRRSVNQKNRDKACSLQDLTEWWKNK